MAIQRTVHLAMSGTRNTSMNNLNHLLCTHRAAKVSKCSLEQLKVLQPVQRLQHMHAFVLALQTPQTDSECGSEVDNTVSSPASGVVQCSRDSSSSWHCAPKGSTKEEPRRTWPPKNRETWGLWFCQRQAWTVRKGCDCTNLVHSSHKVSQER